MVQKLSPGSGWPGETGMTKRRRRRLTPAIAELEGRIVLSGAAIYPAPEPPPAVGDPNTGGPINSGEVPSDEEGTVVSIGMPVDFETGVADWWNWLGSGGDGTSIDPGAPDWDALDAWLDSLGDQKIGEVVISGHGSPTSVGPFNPTSINDPNSDAYKFLDKLKDKMADDGKITIKACNVARGEAGEEFISDMAQLVDCDVIGYTDWYAVTPHGDEITARPDGTTEVTGTYDPYEGSWAQWWAEWKSSKKAKKTR